MRWRIILLLLTTPLLLGLAGGWWVYRLALHPEDRSFADTRALLLPHLQVLLPEGAGPHPTVLDFHGCGGVGSYSRPRALRTVAQGYAVVIIDSFQGRGVDWQANCAGRVLQGPERAADVLVALDYARDHPALDADKLFLMGFSHGGWTALEALALDENLPPGLTDSPGNHLAGVRGLVAWYPYCGFAAGFDRPWREDIPVLMLLAAEDATTDPVPCETIAADQRDSGRPVSWRTYPGVDHGFDLDVDWVRVYDPAIHANALALQFAFLAQHAGQP
jgi:dienelactone hydrolase